MGVAYVGLVHCDSCRCKVKEFYILSSIEKNVPKGHSQGIKNCYKCYKLLQIVGSDVLSNCLRDVKLMASKTKVLCWGLWNYISSSASYG